MAIEAPKKLIHFVLVPYLAQGHQIPMVDLGLLLAERGMHVSIFTTPINALRFQSTADRAEKMGLSLRFVPLQFPYSAVGLPEGCENLDALRSSEIMHAGGIHEGCAMLEEPLKAYIREQTSTSEIPTCIVSDFCQPWTRNVSKELRLPRFVYYTICCFTLLYFKILPVWFEREDATFENGKSIVVGGMPHRVEITKAQAPGLFYRSLDFGKKVEEADSTADGILVNTFSELEKTYVDEFEKHMKKKMWTIGPVSLVNKQTSDTTARGSQPFMDEQKVLSWLDTMQPKSVVYVSLGSLARTSPLQLQEIGMGLESSGHPFIWVIRSPEKMTEVEEWLTAGFEERNKSRSLIIRGWASQVMILSHPSTGGFLTHCGWNSSLEGVTAGVPMITWPGFCDQFLNERFIVDVLGIGVPIGVKEPTYWWQEDVVVKRELIVEAVKKLMDGGEEGDERRRRALEVGEKAKKAMEVEGSSYGNMTTFIDEAIELAANKSWDTSVVIR